MLVSGAERAEEGTEDNIEANEPVRAGPRRCERLVVRRLDTGMMSAARNAVDPSHR